MSEEIRIIFLQGADVVLRPISKTDAPLLARWINDPEVRQYLNAYLPITESEEEEWITNLRKRKPHDIILMIVVDEKPIGTIGIHRISWQNRTGTTGTVIGEKSYQSKGYGTKAKMLLLDYMFNTLNLRKVCSSILAFNERSYNYARRCGYHEEGRLRQHHFHDGQYHDEILLAVFRENWLPLWEAFKEEHNID